MPGTDPYAANARPSFAAEDDAPYTVDTRKSGRRTGRRPAQAAGAGYGARAPRPRVAKPRRRRRRLVLVTIALLVLAWLAFMIWVPLNAWGKVQKVDATPNGSRPSASKGYDYVLVGSDSRQGLTAAQKKELNTGSAEGKRTDSIMLVHVPASGGKSAVISLPRDSYVPIPGHSKNKINAAYSLGGPRLLVETIEQVTGIRVDGYVEIGFGGFASVVDSLGGVDMCLPKAMKDSYANINLKAGCQTLNGPNALGYVRARYSDPLGDLGRVKRQREFLGAVLHKAMQPSTVLVPWRYSAFANAAGAGLLVDQETSMRDVVRVLQALRGVSNGDGVSLTVPLSSTNLQTHVGSAVKWDSAKALELFKAIKEDQPLTAPSPTSGAG